ncbi:DUF2490 domain-containing protein [Sabulilitoribacter arenilitoris]|uniref:DUF2490 domain-containing protein n=1 Tax=Wocania arenilitoris TaxID=2044858 RepID=A0AAE3EQ41_9FLAO|nr:DUF2490 domain-containing protein [Wocania arenilitoris]MCF7568129.1 DUF2490 domain-containing protein [Wocania arenilitoris]
MKKIILPLSLLLVFYTNYAQTDSEDKLGAWYDIGLNHRIAEKISIETYAQLWLYEVNDNFNFFLFKLGYNYHFNPKLTATIYLGYSDIDVNINMSSSHTYERRITEQIVFKHKINKIPLDHRFRIEHRFFKKLDTKSKTARLRYRLGSKFNLNNTLFIRLHNEILSTPKFTNTLENRFYTGLGINISKSSNIKLGYMNRNTPSKANLHRIQAGIFIKTDFRKNKKLI